MFDGWSWKNNRFLRSSPHRRERTEQDRTVKSPGHGEILSVPTHGSRMGCTPDHRICLSRVLSWGNARLSFSCREAAEKAELPCPEG